jgi:hypothetical protein
MSLNYHKPNHNDTANYLVGAIPYVTSSLVVPANSSAPLIIEFPQVTQFITVRCNSTSHKLRVGFSTNGVKGNPQKNYFVLDKNEAFSGDFRVGQIFLLSDDGSASAATVIAGLTPVPSNQISCGMINNWSGSVGVG